MPGPILVCTSTLRAVRALASANVAVPANHWDATVHERVEKLHPAAPPIRAL